MYVRIARFEGADPADIDAQAEELRSDIRAVRDGAGPGGMPAAAHETLKTHVTRVTTAAARSEGVVIGLVFSDTAEGIQAVDAVLDNMTPASGEGSRTSVGIYEVLVDEPMR